MKLSKPTEHTDIRPPVQTHTTIIALPNHQTHTTKKVTRPYCHISAPIEAGDSECQSQNELHPSSLLQASMNADMSAMGQTTMSTTLRASSTHAMYHQLVRSSLKTEM